MLCMYIQMNIAGMWIHWCNTIYYNILCHSVNISQLYLYQAPVQEHGPLESKLRTDHVSSDLLSRQKVDQLRSIERFCARVQRLHEDDRWDHNPQWHSRNTNKPQKHQGHAPKKHLSCDMAVPWCSMLFHLTVKDLQTSLYNIVHAEPHSACQRDPRSNP